MSFIIFFLSIDGTNSNKLATFVNDSKIFSNCRMMVKEFDGRPHLCLYARAAIKKGTELRYDYKAPNLWWRTKVKCILKNYFIS